MVFAGVLDALQVGTVVFRPTSVRRLHECQHVITHGQVGEADVFH